MLKQRLTDVFRQARVAGINSSDRFTKHRKFKSVLELENTLKAPDKCFRDALFNFLLKISDINVHTN